MQSGRPVWGDWGGCLVKNARGAQENLWPKFFLWSAPLRATSSVLVQSTLGATLNSLKTHATKFRSRVGIAAWGERFTLGQIVGKITAEPLWKSSKSLEGSPFCLRGYQDYCTGPTVGRGVAKAVRRTRSAGQLIDSRPTTYQARELSL